MFQWSKRDPQNNLTGNFINPRAHGRTDWARVQWYIYIYSSIKFSDSLGRSVPCIVTVKQYPEIDIPPVDIRFSGKNLKCDQTIFKQYYKLYIVSNKHNCHQDDSPSALT